MVTIDGFEIDVSVLEDHAFESEVTDHPVEDGADVTDHVRTLPSRLMIEGIVTDTPIGPIVDRRDEFVIIDGESFAAISEEAFARLRQIRERRQPVVVETSLRRYDNMILRALSVPRSAQTGDALRFRGEFVEVRIVETERSSVRVAVPRARRKVNRGNKPAVESGVTGFLGAVFDPDGTFRGSGAGSR